MMTERRWLGRLGDRELSRRELLVVSGIAGTGLALSLAGCTPRQTTFASSGTQPLSIPPLAQSQVAGTRLPSGVSSARR